ncbi:MAG: oxidoreductase [Novosphingobium sp.]|nr:SDR family NAD(P)-dependent oxidoreductase [Novosphingobium sp.]MCB2076446.1 SDR family NAD(P)-dependent oxidoreductase [Novosphingobium sp.]
MKGFTDKDVTDQSGKCFVVTGANTGIGLGAAKVLAARGARVLLGCRDKAKAEEAMSLIRGQTPGADVAYLPLDLADLASVRTAAEIAAAEPRIDVLLNNAGVMFPPLSRTKQGFELQFGVNHLGPFALTALLLPKLGETAGSRVVVTSSLAHQRGNIEWDDLNAERSYSRAQRYSDSKLANMLHFFELDRRLRASGAAVTAIGCHPGVAATELMRYAGPFRVFTPLFGLLLNNADQGAWPALQAAVDPSTEPGGYYGPQSMGGMKGPSAQAVRTQAAQDREMAGRLWDVSVEMTGIDPGLAPA